MLSAVQHDTAPRAPGFGRCYGKRRAPSSWRGGVALGGAVIALAGVLACAGSKDGGARPSATLAATRDAQQEFRSLRAQWVAATDIERLALEPRLNAFLRRHPRDERARAVRVQLAWIAVARGDLARARSLVSRVQGGPAGSTRDAATVVEAAIALRAKKPDRALDLLAPLRGKIIDADERQAFGELQVAAAIAAKRYEDATRFMEEWLFATPPEDREAVRDRINGFLQRVPALALEQGLEELDREAAKPDSDERRTASRDWLRKVIRERLIRVAIEARDGQLARRLLDTSPPAVRAGPAGAELARIASQLTSAPRVHGRQVGLVLSTETAELRRRSADVAAGMMRALGLPQSADDPTGVRLQVGDDGGSNAGVPRALAELAGSGSAILVAGFDAGGAEQAAKYSEEAGIPVLVLGAVGALAVQGYAFQLAPAQDVDAAALRAALATAGKTPVADAGEHCADQAAQAGLARFPVQQWKRDRVAALLLTGGPGCSRDAVREATAIGLNPVWGVGFAAAELLPELPATKPVMVATSGSFPVMASRPAPQDLRQWVARHGAPPSLHTALARDAAVLASAALQSFPLERVDEARAVADLHREARRRLASVQAELWTSDARGFAGQRVLNRGITVVTRTSDDGK